MGTPWRLRPGTVLSGVAESSAPSRSAGLRATQATRRKSAYPSRSAGQSRGRGTKGAGEDTVGSVRESREEHLARHGGGQQTCPRCRWYKNGCGYICSYGMFVREQHGEVRENEAWLAERPTRFGGPWGLGCTVCAWFANRAFTEQCGPRASQPQRGSSVSQPQRGYITLLSRIVPATPRVFC